MIIKRDCEEQIVTDWRDLLFTGKEFADVRLQLHRDNRDGQAAALRMRTVTTYEYLTGDEVPEAVREEIRAGHDQEFRIGGFVRQGE